MPEQSERHLAMLIDGDNAQYSFIKQMLEEASRYGSVIIRRAYGDWTTPNLAKWRPVMQTHAIQPIQQFAYTTGKNATDSALIIDAMDILHAKTVQGFCIASSDSDYTRLCTRIRESGLFVMGIGHKRTPEAFRNACDVFVYIENLITPDEISPPVETAAPVEDPAATKKASTVKTKPDTAPTPASTSTAKSATAPKLDKNTKALMKLLRRAFDISEQDDRWVHLGALGHALHKLDPSFDSRTYGHKTLSLLVKALPEHITVKGTSKTGPSAIYVRLKDD